MVDKEKEKEEEGKRNNIRSLGLDLREGKRTKEETNKLFPDWCAICHDGGDTLYCCDRCPKVRGLLLSPYHLITPLPAPRSTTWAATCPPCPGSRLTTGSASSAAQ